MATSPRAPRCRVRASTGHGPARRLVSASALAGRAHGGRRLPRADQAAHHADGGAHGAGRASCSASRGAALAAPPCWPTLVGTGLVAAGASTLNMLLERRTDALMRRTRDAAAARGPPAARRRRWPSASPSRRWAWRRSPGSRARWPPRSRSSPGSATSSSTRRSSRARRSSTIVGAFPGALPPVIGWAAARGTPRAGRLRPLRHPVPLADPALPGHRLDLPRGLRARRACPCCPCSIPEGRITGRQAVANSLALLVVSLTPPAAGLAGPVYLVGALAAGARLHRGRGGGRGAAHDRGGARACSWRRSPTSTAALRAAVSSDRAAVTHG